MIFENKIICKSVIYVCVYMWILTMFIKIAMLPFIKTAFPAGVTYYVGKECTSSGWQPQPQGGWYNMQLSHGMIKRRVGVIYLPQRAKVEGKIFLCLTHSLCFSLAEQSGWGCFQRYFSSLGHRAMASPEPFARSPELQNLSSSSWPLDSSKFWRA